MNKKAIRSETLLERWREMQSGKAVEILGSGTEKVIERAKTACRKSGRPIGNYFVRIDKWPAWAPGESEIAKKGAFYRRISQYIYKNMILYIYYGKTYMIWGNLNQIAELFDRDKSAISRHLRNIFRSQELEPDSVVAKIATTATDGKTRQSEATRHINKIFKNGKGQNHSNDLN